MRLLISPLAAFLTLMITSTTPALANSVSPTQADLDAAIRDYLLRHPEVIVEALDVLEIRQTQERIASLGADLRQDPEDLVFGNPDGDVTIVEFFDYRCPWCQRAHGVVEQVLKDDPNVRLVVKQFPVLGPDSITAARMALAASKQGDDTYKTLHTALFAAGGKMTRAQVLDVAANVGLDIEQLQKDAESPDVTRRINKSYQMARVLGFEGTPAYVIGDTLAPGFLDHANMMQRIADVRAAAQR